MESSSPDSAVSCGDTTRGRPGWPSPPARGPGAGRFHHPHAISEAWGVRVDVPRVWEDAVEDLALEGAATRAFDALCIVTYAHRIT